MHKFFVNKTNLASIIEFCENMPGGFFIYENNDDFNLIYANKALIRMYGCETLDEFISHTGYSFKGMIHPMDYDEVIDNINKQIKNRDGYDYVDYRIITKSSEIRHLIDYGHLITSDDFGEVFYVFVQDDTEEWKKRERTNDFNIVFSDVLEKTVTQYKEIYVIDIDNDFHYQTYPNTSFEGGYTKALYEHVGVTIVGNDNLDEILEFLSLANIKTSLSKNESVSIRYKRYYKETNSIEWSLVSFFVKDRNLDNSIKSVVMTIQNIEDIIKKEQEQKQISELINALVLDYETILVVDYINNKIQSLRAPKRLEGYISDDFISTAKDLINARVYSDDKSRVRDAVSKESLMKLKNQGEISTLSFRVQNDPDLNWVQLKLVPIGDLESSKVIVGIKDVDSEVKRNLLDLDFLKEALANAENANTAKSNFIANISHDMRTPMNAIMGFNSLISHHLNEPNKIKSYSDRIAQASDYLLQLINDVLDIRKIESGNLSLKSSDTSLYKTVKSVGGIIGPLASKKGLAFSYECNITNDRVLIDEIRLKQILLNCLSNSVKYSNKGEIILTVEEREQKDMVSSYVFTFIDFGIGMSKEFINKIFEPFTRENNTTISGIQGAGLGMSITKRLVDILGGTIKIESKKDYGTKIQITLPLKLSSISFENN